MESGHLSSPEEQVQRLDGVVMDGDVEDAAEHLGVGLEVKVLRERGEGGITANSLGKRGGLRAPLPASLPISAHPRSPATEHP